MLNGGMSVQHTKFFPLTFRVQKILTIENAKKKLYLEKQYTLNLSKRRKQLGKSQTYIKIGKKKTETVLVHYTVP